MSDPPAPWCHAFVARGVVCHPKVLKGVISMSHVALFSQLDDIFSKPLIGISYDSLGINSDIFDLYALSLEGMLE